ncbi:cation:proton antiporter [Mumia sp. zg.B21]|uniref:cation:proton antiporter domain-containing protein n=1 Tax=Mumia sp. zg.B21 TaxID=2855447 RepID=UPI001C6F46B9|nr:cation:proton antiporter [Mumia sp. zg.B21]MBW9210948.1 cation:proton antiporter [Mumia sp. zg.B21]
MRRDRPRRGGDGPERAVLSLVLFGVAAVLVAVVPTRLLPPASVIPGLVRAGAETTAQTTVRFTVLLLVSLSALAVVVQLDTILAAFAAGFILRWALPGGDERLETKINGLAFGLLIPVFFVTSGMAIDPGAVRLRTGVSVGLDRPAAHGSRSARSRWTRAR